jgi:hypothetical protein
MDAKHNPDPGKARPERRRGNRYSCKGEAEVRPQPLGSPSWGKILDLSAGGCYVESDFAFDVGRRVEILLKVNHMKLLVLGQVAYHQLLRPPERPRTSFQYVGMGIRFLGMSAGGRANLQELVEEFEENVRREQVPPAAAPAPPERPA